MMQMRYFAARCGHSPNASLRWREDPYSRQVRAIGTKLAPWLQMQVVQCLYAGVSENLKRLSTPMDQSKLTTYWSRGIA